MPRGESKYWEHEKPITTDIGGRNRLVYYPEAGMLQTFVILPTTANGVSKSVTYDLSRMSVTDLESLLNTFGDAIKNEMTARGVVA